MIDYKRTLELSADLFYTKVKIQMFEAYLQWGLENGEDDDMMGNMIDGLGYEGKCLAVHYEDYIEQRAKLEEVGRHLIEPKLDFKLLFATEKRLVSECDCLDLSDREKFMDTSRNVVEFI